MTLEQLLKELNERKMEIRSKLQSGEDLDLEATKKELEDIEARAKELEKRIEMANAINEGKVEVRKVQQKESVEDNAANMYDSAEYRNAFMNYVTKKTEIPAEFRQNQTTATTDVGAIIPPTTLNKIMEKMEAQSKILPLVTRVAYKSGLAIPYNTLVPKATWVNGEGKGSDTIKEALAGTITFSAYKLRCAIAVTLETEVATWSAFESMLVNHLAKAMETALEDAIINGDGSAKPTGVLKDTSKGVKVEVDKKKLTYDVLLKAEGELEEAYENGSKWFMSKKTFMQFMAMTDAQGQPIGRVNYGLASGPEYFLLGRPVICTDKIKTLTADSGAGDVVAFLYDFKNYVLNTTYQVGIKQYEDNETDNIVRKSIMLVDGKPVDQYGLVKLTVKA